MKTRIAEMFVPLTDRRWFIRSLEIFPGALSWSILMAPIVLSIFHPLWVAYFIIAFDLYWFLKAMRQSYFLVIGYRKLYKEERVDWAGRLKWLERPEFYLKATERKLADMVSQHPQLGKRFGRVKPALRQRYQALLNQLTMQRDIVARESTTIKPDELYHAIIVAVYNESRDILEPTVESLAATDYNGQRLILMIACEERGGAQVKADCEDLIKQYGDRFAAAEVVMHPDGVPGEVRGKGPNITQAGRRLQLLAEERGIDPEHIMVTTLDCDHRPSPSYFSNLSFAYALDPNRSRRSFQPIPIFNNNIWDAPAPMRVIATSNSFWLLMETMRPYRLRNFAAHAQGLKALIETDFWSLTSITEDGHQYWRSWFAFDGDHKVTPIYAAIHQDAVLAENYRKTFKAQYAQLRRWAYGITDFPYVVRHSLINPRISLGSKIVQIWRLLEGHISWATAALLISFVAWLPLFLNQDYRTQILAHQLPVIASTIQQIALIGAVIMIAISMISLPPRPAHYHPSKRIFMVLQWALLPLTTILFSSLAALDSQTRLMFGRYFDEFEVTAKNRRNDAPEIGSTTTANFSKAPKDKS